MAPPFPPSSCCRPSTTPFPRKFIVRSTEFNAPQCRGPNGPSFLKLPVILIEMVVSLPKVFQFSPVPVPTKGKEVHYHRKKLNDVITTTSYYIVPLLDYLTGCDPQCFDADHSLVSSFFLASFPRKFTLRCKLPYAPQCQNMDRSNGLFS